MFSESIVIDLVLKNIRQTENLSRTLKHIKSVGIQTNKQLARLREQTNKTFKFAQYIFQRIRTLQVFTLLKSLQLPSPLRHYQFASLQIFQILLHKSSNL